MITRMQRVALAGSWAALMLTGAIFCEGCGHHHHDEDRDRAVVVDEHGWRHEGYYD